MWVFGCPLFVGWVCEEEYGMGMVKCLVYGKMCDVGCVRKLKEVLEEWIGRSILRNGKWVGLVLQSVWKYTSLGVF